MKTLIIVESPSKCKKITEYLNERNDGNEYEVIASKGHIYHIDGLRAIKLKKDSFDINYSEIEKNRAAIHILKLKIECYRRIPTASIIIATDDDREGEFIGWSICNIGSLSLEDTKRIIFREITKAGIYAAIENPTKLNLNRIYSQQCRSMLDILIGYKISPLLWKFILTDNSKGLSAGRCQTPAMRLIMDNNIQCNAEADEYNYVCRGNFFEKGIDFHLSPNFCVDISTSPHTPTIEQGIKNPEMFLEYIHSCAEDHKWILNVGKTNKSVQSAPKPFNTSSLLQQASIQLNINAKTATILAQQLYQEGLITYIRTDSEKVCNTFILKANSYISKKWGNKYVGSGSSSSSTTTAAHEAIRPTNIETDYLLSDSNGVEYDDDGEKGTNKKSLSLLKKKLYKMIWTRTIAACMAQCELNITELQITTPFEKYRFIKSVEEVIFQGWKKAMGQTQEQENNNSLMYYKSLVKNESIIMNEIELSYEIKGKKNVRYNESSLIKQLEKIGIGRPSTYSGIITTLFDRGYVKKMDSDGREIEYIYYKLKNKADNILIEKRKKMIEREKGKLYLTALGISTIDFLLKYFIELFEYKFTENMEIELDKIENDDVDKKSIVDICNACVKEIKTNFKELNEIQKGNYNVGVCDAGAAAVERYKIRFGLNGAYIKDTKTDTTINIKKNINLDLDKVKNGLYKMEEIAEMPYLGTREDGTRIYIKKGLYGSYVEIQNPPFLDDGAANVGTVKRISLKGMKKNLCDINMADIELFINSGAGAADSSNNSKIIRVINDELSIRFGNAKRKYLYYKTEKMFKPVFYSLKGMKDYNIRSDMEIIEWFNNQKK